MTLRDGIALLLIAAATVPAARGSQDPTPDGGEAGYEEIVASVHLHSDASDGASSPLAIARAARAAGVDAVALTDHFLERVSYAPWPVGRVLGVAISRPSAVRYGIKRYLEAVDAAQRQTPGVIVLPGFEVTPYARWTGSMLSRDLQLRGWHRHLLVLGIEDADALHRMPTFGNLPGGVYSAWSLAFLVPVAALAWATRRILRPTHRESTVGGFTIRQRRRPVAAVVVGAAALLILGAGFPYRVERYASVGPDPGDAPMRTLIDWTRAHGGITVWAHPEAAKEVTPGLGVRMVTEPYPELIRTTGADLLEALPEGTELIIPPGGIWDQVLSEHVNGERPRPLFAVTGLDAHEEADRIDFPLLQSVMRVRERSRAGVIEALRSGRHYARWTPFGKEPLGLTTFQVEASGGSAGAGETVSCNGPVRVRLALAGGSGADVTARLVRDGAVIWTGRGTPPLTADVEDVAERSTYYRLDVEGAYPYRLISNPIFVAYSQEST